MKWLFLKQNALALAVATLGQIASAAQAQESFTSYTEYGTFENEIVAVDQVRRGVSSMAGDASQFYLAHGYGDDGYMFKQANTATAETARSNLVSLNHANFKYTQGMATLGEHLYVIENGYLVRVSKNSAPNRAEFKRIGARLWNKTQSMTASSTHLYLVHNDGLYRLDPSDGSYIKFGGNNWKYTGGMAFNPSEPGYIYIVENGSLNKVNTSTGAYSKVGPAGIWQGCRGLTYLDGWLYLLFGKNLWRVNVADPSIREDVHRTIPTCCGSEAVRNAITTSGDSIFFWAGSPYIPCERSGSGVEDDPGEERFSASMWDALFGESCGGDPRSFIVKVTPF